MSKAREAELQKTIDTLTAELKATRESAARDRKEDRRALENLQNTILRKTVRAGDTPQAQIDAEIDHDKVEYRVGAHGATILEARRNAITAAGDHLPDGYKVKGVQWTSDRGFGTTEPRYSYDYSSDTRKTEKTITHWDAELIITAERTICDE